LALGLALAGTVSVVARPDEHDTVFGSPSRAGEDETAQELAPLTLALSATVPPPWGRVAGEALNPEMVGGGAGATVRVSLDVTVVDPVAERARLYFFALAPVLAGTETDFVPDAHARVAGKPARAGLEDTEHDVAAVTTSRNTTVPPGAPREDGDALKELITGAGTLGAAEAVPTEPTRGQPTLTTKDPRTTTARRRVHDHLRRCPATAPPRQTALCPGRFAWLAQGSGARKAVPGRVPSSWYLRQQGRGKSQGIAWEEPGRAARFFLGGWVMSTPHQGLSTKSALSRRQN